MTQVSQRPHRSDAFDTEVLGMIHAYVEAARAELAEMPTWQQSQARRYDPSFSELDEGWVPARLTLITPHFARAERQRASDSLRRLAALGRVELELSSIGRILRLQIRQPAE